MAGWRDEGWRDGGWRDVGWLDGWMEGCTVNG